MKNLKNFIVLAIALLITSTISAQIKNTKEVTLKVYGNCGMCKTKIEKVGNLSKVAKVVWNKETAMATLTFDSTKTNQLEILKRIAFAGYDSDSFQAPQEIYDNLPGCCQYERTDNPKMEKLVNKK